MNTIYFKGTPCHTYGQFPQVGEKAHCFHLVSKDLQDVTCHQYKGRRVILNIFPSLDTPVCAMSVRRFNQEAASIPDVSVLCVSADLPFAAQRFCSAEGINNVTVASAFRSPLFAQKYGVLMVDGPLAGLLARAVIVLDSDLHVIYAQLVNEVTTEPDYDAALSVLK
ncbi:MAG: thiol peroxidase [Muribaculaceae bacterium]|nr:thiol peroxidase [Muribaculaceae bacterium]